MANTESAKTIAKGAIASNPTLSKLFKTIQPATDFIGNHPYKSLGLGVGTAANLGGLFDNNKLAGQLIGGLGGAGLSYALNATPYGMALAGLTGGGIGSLFDKLRAKQELQAQQVPQIQPQQYYQK